MPNQSLVGILATVGNTPLVRLQNLFSGAPFHTYAKLERFNPGGSIKDRSALSMLLAKIQNGELVPGRSVVVESSSGNLAVGIAQICRYYGLRFICVVDAKTTDQNIAILKAYQAEIEVVTVGDPETGGQFLPVRLRRVRELVESIPHAYTPNQYANPLNPAAQESTVEELLDQLGRIDYLFCATSTFGTLRGCAEYLRARGQNTRIVAVDAVGSVIFGHQPAPRLIPGYGSAVMPPLADLSLATEVIHVSDLECVVACRRLVRGEAILAGGSSGATAAAMHRIRDRIPAGAHCVLIFPDGGDRYLDTIYSDEWVTKHFGEVSHMWKDE